MWRILQQSVEGTAHVRDGVPCQDFCQALVTRPREETFLVAACADGAGSASLSQEGSRIACTELIRLICSELETGLRLDQVDRTAMAGWFGAVRAQLGVAAQARQVPTRQLACTLLVAVVGDDIAITAQVGDGAIVVREADSFRAVFWPQSGEALNLTNFITDDHFESSLEFSALGRVEEISLLTDGLQLLALNFAQRLPHRQFFEPMFNALRASDAPDELLAPFRSFLGSAQVTEKTDDDKTLVLATRLFNAEATTRR